MKLRLIALIVMLIVCVSQGTPLHLSAHSFSLETSPSYSSSKVSGGISSEAFDHDEFACFCAHESVIFSQLIEVPHVCISFVPPLFALLQKSERPPRA